MTQNGVPFTHRYCAIAAKLTRRPMLFLVVLSETSALYSVVFSTDPSVGPGKPVVDVLAIDSLSLELGSRENVKFVDLRILFRGASCLAASPGAKLWVLFRPIPNACLVAPAFDEGAKDCRRWGAISL